MADRRLVAIFPKAQPADVSDHRCKTYLDLAKDKFGVLPLTFFNMSVYDNPIGIELECETFHGDPSNRVFFRLEADGSLKKKGVELISVPLRRTMIDYALAEIQAFCYRTNVSFGHRTSVHIHVNVSEYTWNQLVTLVALYALLEGVYFSFVNETRRGNTFCYRIVGTDPKVTVYPTAMGGHGDLTTKYCAFNIHPISRQLTVEFRHLEGTRDKKRLRRWIQICTKLVNFVGALDPKVCRADLLKAIQEGKVQSEWVPKIWGHTAMIFDRALVAQSIARGELWATAALTETE